MSTPFQKFRRASLSAAALVLLALVGCATTAEGPFYEATAAAKIEPGKSFKEGQLAAIQLAEKRARDEVLAQALKQPLPNGATLEEAFIADPVTRARVYDTVRTANVSEKKTDPNGQVTVTVKLDSRLLDPILKAPPVEIPR